VKKGVFKKSDKIDFWNGKLYDLVIDTYATSKEETLELVLKAIGYDRAST